MLINPEIVANLFLEQKKLQDSNRKLQRQIKGYKLKVAELSLPKGDEPFTLDTDAEKEIDPRIIKYGAAQVKYVDNHREQTRAYQKKYRAEHPEKFAVYREKANAKKKEKKKANIH